MVSCPVCMRTYARNPVICSCGFDGLAYHTPEKPELYKDELSAESFRVYKFAKRVLFGELPYEASQVYRRVSEGRMLIDGTPDRRGVILIDRTERDVGMRTVADEGLLAFRTDVLALILNVDSVHSSFLDESAVRSLLLGRDVKEFRNGIMISPSQLRFITVDSANPAFTAEGNVLFTKDMRRLVCYAPSRPEKEYRVPESVRELGRYSFRFPSHLERLYLPRGIAVSDNALVFYEGREPEIEYY